MAQVVDVNITMDKDLSNKFDSVCHDLGVNVSAVFNAFAESVVSNRSIPAELDVEPDPFYSPENMERLKKSIANLEAGGGTYHELIEVDDEEDMG